METHTKEQLKKLTPAQAIQYLKDGNDRFIHNLSANRNLLQEVSESGEGQFPFAAVLSCMDSRTSPELIFDLGMGDIFSIRIAGNILNEDILGSLEFATKVVGAKVIMVLGHSKCGAIIGACDDVEMGNLSQLLEKVNPAIEAESETERGRNGSNETFVEHVTELNVKLTMESIYNESSIIRELVKKGEILIIGGIYDVETGKVEFIED
jgi:carbonic anhydrase